MESLSGVWKPKEKPKNFRNVMMLIPASSFSTRRFQRRAHRTAPPAYPLTPQRISASPPEANWLLGSDLGGRSACVYVCYVLCTAQHMVGFRCSLLELVWTATAYFILLSQKRGAAYLLKGQADIWWQLTAVYISGYKPISRTVWSVMRCFLGMCELKIM